jgi:hypothetical protein
MIKNITLFFKRYDGMVEVSRSIIRNAPFIFKETI